jgi:hypothetical protein
MSRILQRFIGILSPECIGFPTTQQVKKERIVRLIYGADPAGGQSRRLKRHLLQKSDAGEASKSLKRAPKIVTPPAKA